VERAAEALVVALVLPPPSPAGDAAEQLHGREVGQSAAYLAQHLWPARYRWERGAPARDRLLQRYAIVNAWRSANLEPPLVPPPAPDIAAVAPEEARARIEGWLAADPGAAARREAADAVVGAGLGMLPALREARARLEPNDARASAFDNQLLRPTALILREVTLAPRSLPTAPELAAFLAASRGKPVSGGWVAQLLRQFVRSAPAGTNQLDLVLVRPDDGTGVEATLELSGTTSSGMGHTTGWSLVHGGWDYLGEEELRSEPASDVLAGRFDPKFQVADTEEIGARWTLTRVR